jgi:hypothetical protein
MSKYYYYIESNIIELLKFTLSRGKMEEDSNETSTGLKPLCTVCYKKYGKASVNNCTCAFDPGLGPDGEPLSAGMRTKVEFKEGEDAGYVYSYGLAALHPSKTEFICLECPRCPRFVERVETVFQILADSLTSGRLVCANQKIKSDEDFFVTEAISVEENETLLSSHASLCDAGATKLLRIAFLTQEEVVQLNEAMREGFVPRTEQELRVAQFLWVTGYKQADAGYCTCAPPPQFRGYAPPPPQQCKQHLRGVVNSLADCFGLGPMTDQEFLDGFEETWQELQAAQAEAAFQPGSSVMIVSLVTRFDLNGRRGIVQNLEPLSGRYRVKVEGEKKFVALKAINLKAAEGAMDFAQECD